MNVKTKDKFNLYKSFVFSSNEREDGTSQVSDAEFAIKNNMVSKEEYMDLFNTCQKNNINMPNTDKLKELINQDLSLNTYIDYRVQIKEETVNQRKSGEIEEDEDISNSSKIKIVLNSSYSKTEKEKIYENYIGTQDELYNNAMKYTGININEYLKYKTQEFTSDKTDDGTVNGKSVSGSKKAKVYDYVNKMKITGEQRMLLLGTQYKLTDSERATLADYVKNLNITKNQKIEIYKKLQGFTVYKDGRVTY